MDGSKHTRFPSRARNSFFSPPPLLKMYQTDPYISADDSIISVPCERTSSVIWSGLVGQEPLLTREPGVATHWSRKWKINWPVYPGNVRNRTRSLSLRYHNSQATLSNRDSLLQRWVSGNNYQLSGRAGAKGFTQGNKNITGFSARELISELDVIYGSIRVSGKVSDNFKIFECWGQKISLCTCLLDHPYIKKKWITVHLNPHLEFNRLHYISQRDAVTGF